MGMAISQFFRLLMVTLFANPNSHGLGVKSKSKARRTRPRRKASQLWLFGGKVDGYGMVFGCKGPVPVYIHIYIYITI